MTNESQLNLRIAFRRQNFQLSFLGGGGNANRIKKYSHDEV